jgi:type IV pilus assembly protein PilX
MLTGRDLNTTQQRGAILVVSMMLLLMLTIIGVTAMNVVTIEERMAGNLRDANIAFQGAEAALRDVEGCLAPLANEPTPGATITTPCTVKIWKPESATLANMAFEDPTWWDTNGKEYGADGTTQLGAGIHSDPYSVIEFQEFVRDNQTIGHLPVDSGRVFYRLTGWSQGGSAEAISVLQTTFAKRFN